MAARPVDGAEAVGAFGCAGGRRVRDGPSLTAVDAAGVPITPGLLYGDGRGRVSGVVADGPFPVGEAAEFLRWTAARAPDAAGYWAAPAVANHALAGEAVVDFPTAFTASRLFDGDGWNATACAERGATPEQMPRVAAPGAAVGRVGGAVLAAGAVDALCEQMVSGPTTTETCWCCAVPP